jgi:hypothetical protein
MLSKPEIISAAGETFFRSVDTLLQVILLMLHGLKVKERMGCN